MSFKNFRRHDLDEWIAPPRPHRLSRDRRHGPPESEPQKIDLDVDLPGAIYEVPDKMWGIEAPGREWHPGICVCIDSRLNLAMMVKGTSQALLGDLTRYFLLEPTSMNGLKLPTAFNLMEAKLLSRPKVALLHFGRLLGRLHPEELVRLQEDLTYLIVGNRGSGI